MLPRSPAQICLAAASAVAVVVGLWYGLHSAFLGYSLLRPMIFWDQMNATAEEYFAYRQGFRVWLAALFRFHNEHRIVTSRIVFLVDSTLFDMTNRFSIFVIYAGLLAIGVLILVLGLRVRKALLIGLGTFAALGIIWSASQNENLSWGFQVEFPFVHLFALLTLTLLAFSFTRRNWLRWLILAAVADALTVYSMAAGVLVGAAAIALALWLRSLNRIPFIFFLIIHVCLVVLYFQGWPSANKVTSSPTADYAIFFVRYIGSLARPDLTFTAVLGVALTTVAAGMVVVLTAKALMRGRCDVETAVLIAMACFCLLEAAATTIGRTSMGPYQAIVSRYSTTSAILSLCLLAALWRLSTWAYFRSVIAVCLVGLTVIANEPINVREWIDRMDVQDVAALSFINGVYSADQLGRIFPSDFPDRTLAERTYRKLAELRKGPFSLAATIYRAPLNSVPVDLNQLPPCQAHVDAIQDQSDFLEIQGWLNMHGWVLAYGKDLRLIGFTLSSVRRNDVALALNQPESRVGFDLFLDKQKLRGDVWPVQLVAVMDKDRQACALKVQNATK